MSSFTLQISLNFETMGRREGIGKDYAGHCEWWGWKPEKSSNIPNGHLVVSRIFPAPPPTLEEFIKLCGRVYKMYPSFPPSYGWVTVRATFTGALLPRRHLKTSRGLRYVQSTLLLEKWEEYERGEFIAEVKADPSEKIVELTGRFRETAYRVGRRALADFFKYLVRVDTAITITRHFHQLLLATHKGNKGEIDRHRSIIFNAVAV